MKWEYCMVVQPKSHEDPLAVLNRYGADGWSLVGIDYGCFIFKREAVSAF